MFLSTDLDVILTRSGSLDTSYRVLDDATSERKISQGRHRKDYLVKSEIGSTRNLKRNSHQILSNAKFPLLKNENNTYSVSEQKIEIDMGLLNSLGQNYNEK